MNGQTSPVRRRTLLRAAFASLLGLALAAGGIELGFRFLLFSPSSIARRLGAGLRKPERFSDPMCEEEYWRLQDLFLDPAHSQQAPNPDPVCGWTGPITPGTYAPTQPYDLRGRRPILLYGDSYAQCVTPVGQCFQTLLENSDLADRYCLVNYGVGGYGLDQEYLLLKHSIDRWKDLDPIVVVSFLVDDDFSRNVLAFRCWPKPRLRIDGRSFRREEVPFWPAGIDLEIGLAGAKQLELVVERTGKSAGSEWIHIAGARLEWVP